MAIRAVVVDPEVSGKLALREVPEPQPGTGETLVRVEAVSLNPGEVRRALREQAGWRPGWDLAGVVERAAADGSGPAVGTRVFGMKSFASWAEVVAVRSDFLADIPEGLSFAQAATLPIAGLTPLRGLEKGGSLLDKPVLITGASGAVGIFACQLARLSGARVYGLVRRGERVAVARDAGAHEVIVGDSAEAARSHGPFHLILESLGGESLGAALTMLAKDGTCVFFGTSVARDTTFDAHDFYLTGGTALYGLALSHEHTHQPPAEGLRRLARMVADGRLRTTIEIEAPWTEVARLVQQQAARENVGKIVMRVGV